jgi:predicted kinase
MIICITGLPGSGKSSVAEQIEKICQEKQLTVLHYTTDWVRHWLFPSLVGNKEEMGRDFTADELERSYNGLYMLFEQLIKSNPNLVLITDGTFRKESQRETLKMIAEKYESKFLLILVETEEEIAISRLNQRLNDKKGAGPESYFAAKKQYEMPQEKIIINNNGTIIDLKKEIERKIIPLLIKEG